MSERMLKFTSRDREPPQKRAAPARRSDFGEIVEDFTPEAAALQASRCSQCGVPFCQYACPLGNNIPDWLKLAAEGRTREAYEASAATNPMPEVCGRICPQDRLCEGDCVVEQSGHGTVTIGAVEKHLAETAWAEGWVAPIRPLRRRAEKIAIVGAGPAGLAAAESLRRRGYEITVYDRHDRAGGLLVYGIPNFKLDKAVVARRVERLAASGIAFRLGVDIGRDIAFETLRNEYDAVLLAVGVYAPRPLGLTAPPKGVVKALDFLIAANRAGFGEGQAPALDAKAKSVVVIGGGDTAMDCVRTAVRQGAKSVTCLYRRDRASMPGSRAEVSHAEEEGVTFDWLAMPTALVGDARRMKQVRATRVRLVGGASRAAPEPIEGGAFELPADLVVEALGFEPEHLPSRFGAPDLELTRHGALRIDPRSFETSLPGVFAAGDIVRGASLVVWALRDGLDAADAIHAHLCARESARVAAE